MIEYHEKNGPSFNHYLDDMVRIPPNTNRYQ
jgi:hypothetical protein